MASESSFETVDTPMDTIPALPMRFTSSFDRYEPVSLSSSTLAQDGAVTKRDSDFYMECDMLTLVVSDIKAMAMYDNQSFSMSC